MRLSVELRIRSKQIRYEDLERHGASMAMVAKIRVGADQFRLLRHPLEIPDGLQPRGTDRRVWVGNISSWAHVHKQSETLQNLKRCLKILNFPNS